MGKKVSLLKALKNHQARFGVSERVQQAQREAAVKRKVSSSKRRGLHDENSTWKGKGKEEPKRYTIPFEEDDRILLIGEGNFSFTLSLIKNHHIPPYNILATTLDSETDCYAKYPNDASAIVSELRNLGARVVFGADATKLEKSKDVIQAKGGWNKVVFNFPHAGKSHLRNRAGITDQDRNILTNQKLLLGFLRSVAPILSKGVPPKELLPKKPRADSDDEQDEPSASTSIPAKLDQDDPMDENESSDDDEFTGVPPASDFDDGGPINPFGFPPPARQGIILVTLRDSVPYTLWDLPRLAKRPPHAVKGLERQGPEQPEYTLVRSYRFWPEAYPGYEHRRTRGGAGTAGEEREEGMGGTGGVCKTWEFVLRTDDARTTREKASVASAKGKGRKKKTKSKK
ncbi:hypothetical protein FRC04_009425 [Tulasnella sp. 424]|nr:hypothetical protein FRC04_009425 [Tulasnella sp. 424]KAG8971879.1 hypothetical protein FRC05_010547 [Tulasnella sp. 425]